MTITKATSADVILDRKSIWALVNGDPELLRQLVTAFFQDCPRWLASLKRGIRLGKTEHVRQAAHSLGGGAATFHARAVQLAAGKLETMAREGHLTEAKQLYRQLTRTLRRLQPVLAELAELPEFASQDQLRWLRNHGMS